MASITARHMTRMAWLANLTRILENKVEGVQPPLTVTRTCRSPASAEAETVVAIFGVSAGAERLLNSALRASPKILLFALSEL